MVCFVTNHYTAKAFSVLALSIRGLGMYRYLDKRRLLGYDIEGMAAKRTLAAIESYQRKHNIPPGKLSRQALLEHIFQYVRSKNFKLPEKQ